MEYSRKVGLAEGPTAPAVPQDSRVMDFGSVFLLNPTKGEGDDAVSSAPSTAGSQQPGINVAELVVSRGFGTVIRHRDFEERSNYYDALLAAESRAISGKKGMHSAKDPPVMHITDLTTVRNIISHYKLFLSKCIFLLVDSYFTKFTKTYRHQLRKPETFCHSCIAVEKFLLLLNMCSAGIVSNSSFQRKLAASPLHFLVSDVLAVMSPILMKQLL